MAKNGAHQINSLNANNANEQNRDVISKIPATQANIHPSSRSSPVSQVASQATIQAGGIGGGAQVSSPKLGGLRSGTGSSGSFGTATSATPASNASGISPSTSVTSSSSSSISSTGRKWVPPSLARNSSDPNEQANAVFRRVRGILNKICPEKFDKLTSELLLCGLDSPKILKGVIILIFEKALDEPKYSSMYAQLCRIISERAPNFETNPDEKNTFQILLLKKAKDEFEKRGKASEFYDSKDGTLNQAEEEAKLVAKQKMLGNIKFICELGRQKLLDEDILHLCIHQLLMSKSKSLEDKAEDLECLSQIMKTVGHLLDNEKSSNLMEQYFARIAKYEKDQKLPQRIRFMLRDVIELRYNKWIPRRIARENGPKTIYQIRSEAAKDLGVFIPPQQYMFGPLNTRNSMPYGQAPFYPGMPGFPGGGLEAGLFALNALQQMQMQMANFGLGTGPGVISSDFTPLGSRTQMPLPPQMNIPAQSSTHNNRPQNIDNQVNQQRQTYYSGRNSQNRQDQQQTQQQQQGRVHKQSGQNQSGPNQGPISSPLRNNSSSNHNQSNQNRSNAELPPRFQKRQLQQPQPSHGAMPQQAALQSSLPGRLGPQNPPINPLSNLANRHHMANEISLRPPENSIVTKPVALLQNKMGLGDTIDPFGGVGGVGYKPAPEVTVKPIKTQKAASRPSNPADQNDQNSQKVEKKPSAKEILIGKVNDIVEKYYEDEKAVEEITSKLKGLNMPKNSQPDAFVCLIKKSLDKSDSFRDNAAQVLVKLAENQNINSSIYVKALKLLLNDLEALEATIPRTKSHIAALLAKLIAEEILDLKEAAEPLENGRHYPLFLLCLQQLDKLKGKEWVLRKFNSSKVDLMTMVPQADRSKDRLAEILEDRGLSFLQPLFKIESELSKQLATDPSPAAVYKCIKENVDPSIQKTPGFVSLLFTALLKHVNGIKSDSHGKETNPKNSGAANGTQVSTEKEKEFIHKFSPILLSYVHDSPQLQLVLLYSLQAFCHSLGFPKGMILRWFVMLYNAEIVEEEVFLRWREDINENYPGKGQALFQVNAWLTWLEEANDESEEEEEDEDES